MKKSTVKPEIPLHDVYLSAFLALRGQEPAIVLSGSRAVFMFQSDEALNKLMREYNEGAPVSVAEYANAVRRLRSRMMAVRDGGRW